MIHLPTGKRGEVRHVSPSALTVVMDDTSQPTEPWSHFRPAPVPADVGVIVGGRA